MHAGCGHDHGRARPLGQGAAAHAQARRGERKKLGWTLALTSFILVAEVAGGFLSRSLSLLSDAGHMFSDVVAQALSLAAVVIALKPADARRTYGWHRIEILAALLNGLTLLLLAGAIVWHGIERLSQPVEIRTGLMLVVASVGLVANVVGAWLLHDLKSLNARGAYLHILFDTLSSVLVLVGGVVMYLTRGLYWLDAAASIAIGAFILFSAYRIVREAVDVLLEAVPQGIDLAGVTHAIDHIDGVSEVHDLHIWTITSGMYALSAHIVVKDGSTDNDALLNRVKEMLLRDFAIGHTTLQLESPDYEHVGHVC